MKQTENFPKDRKVLITWNATRISVYTFTKPRKITNIVRCFLDRSFLRNRQKSFDGYKTGLLKGTPRI